MSEDDGTAACLNPCFSGNRFGSLKAKMDEGFYICLNPCFSGNRFGRYVSSRTYCSCLRVLILVLVEIGLGVGVLMLVPLTAMVGS